MYPCPVKEVWIIANSFQCIQVPNCLTILPSVRKEEAEKIADVLTEGDKKPVYITWLKYINLKCTS